MFLPKKSQKIISLFMLYGKGHKFLSKPAGKSSKSTKSEIFLRDFFNKIEDIGKQQLLMH